MTDTPARAETARIVRVSGSLVEARPLPQAGLYHLARVGEQGLLGEVMRLEEATATIQVYEETSGLALGDRVEVTGEPLQVELGPGLLGAVLDGVGRPLRRIADAQGDFLAPGADAPTLDPTRSWAFEATAEPGTELRGGDVLGQVEVGDRSLPVLVPPDVRGRLEELSSGAFTVRDPLGRLADGTPLRLAHRWPVRTPRPVVDRLPGDRPLVTGQRIFDFLFPVAEGGSVAVPGGFGTGKTVIEQSLARHADTDIIVYVGCGERGNEMAELLDELPGLEDPRTGRALAERTVLVVNTSNMPVAARESSVYLGLTVAEYFRDLGLRVAVLADSLSRWAEALREIGSRLGEMPGEEGYPMSLGNRLGALFERTGRATCLGSPERTGAVTLVAAISPPGGDFSEPVTQAALRVVGTLWALDADLAHQRQFPAVSWDVSYTAHAERTAPWFAEHGGTAWASLRQDTLRLLQDARDLREVAELVGVEALEDPDRLVLEAARVVREVVLGQNAFDPHDTRSPPEKTWLLARLSLDLYRAARTALERGVPWDDLDLAAGRRALVAVRDAPEDDRGRRAEEAEERLARLREDGGAP